MQCTPKGLSTPEGKRGQDGEMLVVTKNRTNVWAGGKGSCAVCIDLQAVEVLELFGVQSALTFKLLEFSSSLVGGPFSRGVWEKGTVL